MDLLNIESLGANPKNPRRINKTDFANLVTSIKRFGDLSGIVFNETTGQLVGGHQRIEAFKSIQGPKPIVITKTYDTPTKKGTTSIGYVSYDDEFYSYRTVRWDAGFENAANIAANRIQGEFDLELLAQVDYELSQLENGQELLELSGQDDAEIKRLLKTVGVEEETEPEPDDDGTRPLEFRLTEQQLSVVVQALGFMKSEKQLTMETNKDLDGNALYYICTEFNAKRGADNAAATDTQQ